MLLIRGLGFYKHQIFNLIEPYVLLSEVHSGEYFRKSEILRSFSAGEPPNKPS